MKKITVKIDEDTHRALVAFTVLGLNDKKSLDEDLSRFIFDRTEVEKWQKEDKNDNR